MTEQDLIETRMRSAYQRQVSEVLTDPDKYTKKGERHIGLEVEYPVVQTGGITCAQTQRDQVVAKHHFLSPELGESQIELHTDPLPISCTGVMAMAEQLTFRERQMTQTALKNGLQILRSGTNPWLSLSETVRTDKPKYKQVPDHYNRTRTLRNTTIGEIEPLDVGDLAVISLTNALQVNIEARDVRDGIDLLNRSLMISPQMTAIAGNARYLAATDTGIQDLRMLAWSLAVDTLSEEERRKGKETRVSLPSKYYDSMANYLENVGQFPFILDDPDNALRVGIGMYWKDARLKIIGDSLVVELRPLSTQPTIEEDLACTLMYLGRLTWSQVTAEPLLPMSLVRQSKHQAMLYGLKGRLWNQVNSHLQQEDAKDLLNLEINRAQVGLSHLNLDHDLISLLNILRDRLVGGTPSDKMHQYVIQAERQGATCPEAIGYSLKKLREGI